MIESVLCKNEPVQFKASHNFKRPNPSKNAFQKQDPSKSVSGDISESYLKENENMQPASKQGNIYMESLTTLTEETAGYDITTTKKSVEDPD